MATPSEQSADPAGEVTLVIDTVALLRIPGTRRDVDVDLSPRDVATSVVSVQRVHGTLVVESMADSLTVTGSLTADWEGTCRRCLEPTEGATEVDIQEIYERRPVEGETYELGHDAVDLAPMLLEQVVLALPLAPLCAEDCAGPAPDAFPAVVEADVDLTDEPVGDPRWAALDALKFDDD